MVQRILVVLLLVVLVFSGCKKEKVNLESDFQENDYGFVVKNNTLIFASPDDFKKLLTLYEKEPEFVETILRQSGLVSLKDIQIAALDVLNSNNSNDMDIMAWLGENRDLFYLAEDENGEKEVKPYIDDEMITNFLNKDQIMQIGNRIYGFSKNHIMIGKVESKSLIIGNIKRDNHDQGIFKDSRIDIFRRRYSEIKKGKPTRHVATAIKDERGCSKDRKVKIVNEIKTVYIFRDGIYLYYIYVGTKTSGYRKRLCFWVPYKTQLEYRNVKGQISYYQGSKTKYFYIGGEKSYSDKYSIGQDKLLVWGTTSKHELKRILLDVYFFKDYGEATSRGVGNLWAIIKYNF